MESPNGPDDFIETGLAAFGIEADEVELAVIRAAHQVFWPPILDLLALDTGQLPEERAPELSRPPRR